MLARLSILLYGLAAYLAFVAVFAYAIGFLANLEVLPRTIDTGRGAPLAQALAIDLGLLLLFAVQHTVMARPRFKAWWTRLLPEPIERSTFVLVASAVLALLFWQWRALPEVVWQVTAPAGRAALWTLYGAGFALVLASSFAIDHFELFGLRQAWNAFRGREHVPARFVERPPYTWVRHPLMLGFLVAFWSAPTMSLGRLVFALATSGYVSIGLHVEERDLVAAHGQAYLDYRRRVPGLIPFARRRGATGPGSGRRPAQGAR